MLKMILPALQPLIFLGNWGAQVWSNWKSKRFERRAKRVIAQICKDAIAREAAKTLHRRGY